MKKFTIISSLTVLLVIPIFFGAYRDLFITFELEVYAVLILILGFFLILLTGWTINSFGFNETDVESMRDHNVIEALINGNKIILWIFFPITMIMEELIFRYYLLGFLALTLHLELAISILISSLVFSLYHIHTWFTFKSSKILLINISYTLILGLFNGYIFFMFGIIPCIITHYLIALSLYYNLYRKNYRI